ncbi:uroporphyrinogen-III synthase [Candidatus Halobeggiatoa sp. HSG11]|nr:uroporphyrinogen-III synthase [Candidatus Halobeggiatoa sp. HSG11]
MSLNNLKILVTRPSHQSEPLCKLVESYGGEAIRLPVINIVKSNNNWQDNDFNSFDMAIFISSNAVEHTLSNINLSKKLKLFAVGKTTAKTMQKHKLTPLCPPPPFNSEALLLMPQLQNIANKKIVIFRGEGGRELLANTLQQRGAYVKYIPVYKRVRPLTPINDIYADIVTITSGEGLENLLIMLDKYKWVQENPMVVISERLSVKAKQLGIQAPIFVASTASDEGILMAILQAAKECACNNIDN